MPFGMMLVHAPTMRIGASFDGWGRIDAAVPEVSAGSVLLSPLPGRKIRK
jgi:hypothetical protein